MEALRSRTSMITEFTLTDVNDELDDENVKPIIASSIFYRIAQSLEPNSGLFPSLSRLRIIQADIYFPCLHLLHTPSLRTLEANVPDHHHPNFYSFLTTLVYKAPLLEEIILGPGQFPLKSLQAILKFTHLRQLELRDSASSIDFTFLQGVGTLSNLESFILDARSCKYTARIPENEYSKTPPAEHTEPEDGSQMLQPSLDIDSAANEDTTEVGSSSPTLGLHKDKDVDQPLPPIYNRIPCDNLEDSSISTMGGFYQLKKFHFIGGLSLLQDMIPYIASSTLEDISITVDQQPPQDLEAENLRQEAETEKRRRELDRKTELKIEVMENAMKIEYGYSPSHKINKASTQASTGFWKTVSSRRQVILEKKATRWKEQETQYQAQCEERKKAERVQKCQTHIAILQTVSSRWSATLKIVGFNNLNRSESSQPLSTPRILPKLVYGTLFCHPKLETLEFKLWELDSVEDFLMSMKSSIPKNLKQLRLPIDDPGSAISLSGLLDIAEACPMLESLQCCVDTLPPIPEYSFPTSKALSHRLQSLFIANNPASLWDFNQLLLVARHFYLTFPYLQTIESVEGPNAEQWVRIRELVKMFQAIREDDMYRFSWIKQDYNGCMVVEQGQGRI